MRKGPGGGGDSGPFWTGCVNTILKEMGPFSASSEWHEWTNFHSKWVSYWPGHSIWVPLFPILGYRVKNMAHPEYSIGPPFKQALQSKVGMWFHIKWAFK